jgi:hypothetical protein
MSLLHREPSPAQAEASRANSQLSTGPHTAEGMATSSRNGLEPRRRSPVEALHVQALGEDSEEFERMQQDLTTAMRPRDGWESAWVQDIAVLRWRLARLQRAEAGILATQKRRLAGDRKREAMPASGAESLQQGMQIRMTGFTGLPDSAWKFQQVLQMLHTLRDVIWGRFFDDNDCICFKLLYGDSPGAQGATLQGRFVVLSKRFAEGKLREGDESQIELLSLVDAEISDYEQKQALYVAEHLAEDPAREDTGLMLPNEDLDKIIRYESHLENQIERKLRQFYARRRESSLPEAVAQPTSGSKTAEISLACQSAQA